MKEICINLELYFESYEFSNFRNFFRIFLNLFSIFEVLKTIEKRKKGVIFIAQDPRGCDVARKAMWQSHADPRKHLRGAELTRVYIHIYS